MIRTGRVGPQQEEGREGREGEEGTFRHSVEVEIHSAAEEARPPVTPAWVEPALEWVEPRAAWEDPAGCGSEVSFVGEGGGVGRGRMVTPLPAVRDIFISDTRARQPLSSADSVNRDPTTKTTPTGRVVAASYSGLTPVPMTTQSHASYSMFWASVQTSEWQPRNHTPTGTGRNTELWAGEMTLPGQLSHPHTPT